MQSPTQPLTSSGPVDGRTSKRQAGLAGASLPFPPTKTTEETSVLIKGQPYLSIRDVDRMPPFLMSVVSDSDFWLFVGSNGGFTAGRVDPDHAIFPYQTADKILNHPKGSGALCLLDCGGIPWEPWTTGASPHHITRNLYKHVAGTSVIFEEINQSLGLLFRWELAVSDRFGLVRTCHLENLSPTPRRVRILDGWHHLLPSGVTQETYARFSYLAAAYMRHEALSDCGLGIYTLNSGITDRAEPCESLRAACAWSLGLESPTLLLSDRQVDAFRRGVPVQAETEARGTFGAHLLASEFLLPAHESREWLTVADTGLDHAGVSRLRDHLRMSGNLRNEVAADLSDGILALRKRIAGAGAIQQSADGATSAHHFANVLFNCMRGGTLHDNYSFPRHDFQTFLNSRNREISRHHREWASSLPDPCTLRELNDLAAALNDPQLSRLAGEYLPICFSRRHGDPSRPWNRFEIHTKDSAGRPLFNYAGNWRDIFQNWESLAYSYPECFGSMISIFLNASTADGYNPYRITREGIDWEVFDAEDPWSHIGYWGDHQIIYLLRLLEGEQRFHPGRLTARLNERRHSHAHVPYEIKGFNDLLKDPKHSIRFNEEAHRELLERAGSLGGDGKLLTDSNGGIILVSLIEKLLIPLLVKLSNLVPNGGIWLNTQRPEWNDANNALAGWGLSVVTVGYIRRYLVFLDSLLADGAAPATVDLSKPVAELLASLNSILPAAASPDTGNSLRRKIIEDLGLAGEKHRHAIYAGEPLEFQTLDTATLREFNSTALAAVDATLISNRRDDGLYHSYNLLEIRGGEALVHHLDLMLEGQVSALSSGAIEPEEALRLMTAMRESPLYRGDQNSYLLYPDRVITPFLERNTLPPDWETRIPHLAALVRDGQADLIRIAGDGLAHFHPDLTNSRDLRGKLDRLADNASLKQAAAADLPELLELWEQVFHHRSFTGRSGAMFGFEGLGSIYWHMVAKLLLAVQEIHDRATAGDPGSMGALMLEMTYAEVRNGLGFTKTSEVYGAFPTDPYSHTPRDRGAQQPGMTGQVKEEILTRMGELGVHIEAGCVRFAPVLLKEHEFFTTPHEFDYIDIHGNSETWSLGPGTLAFTLFQVPVCYRLGQKASINLEFRDGGSTRIEGNILHEKESSDLFARRGLIRSITVSLPETHS